MPFSDEIALKVRKAKSAEEIFALAKENGVELTEEQAQQYFSQIHGM